jgi:tetratricopeptide (TPR) repeat protein
MHNAHFQRGSLLYEQGRYAEAVGELRMQLGQHAEDSLAHGLLALCLAEQEKYDEATHHAQQSIHVAPDQPFGHYALAQVMLHRNRFEEAHAAILEAIRCNPYDADYFAVLASLHLRASRWREALETANRGLTIEPEHPLCTNLRAQALVNLGDRPAAAATMGQALARRPDDPYTHANQGWALLHQGDPNKAMEHFREALRLEPGLEWARAGIVESLKARNIIYRWMLAYFLWMARLQPGVRWGLVIGAYFGNRIIRQLADKSPQLAPFLYPLLFAYFGFVLMTWLAYPLFNLLLRFHPFGRHALSPDQTRGANVLAASLGVTLACLVAALATGIDILLFATVMFTLLALPASAIYVCESGWPRQAMTAITLGLGFLVLSIVLVGFTETWWPEPVRLAMLAILPILPLAMLASQFAAMYLTRVTPQK